jgi:hypothetical protein
VTLAPTRGALGPWTEGRAGLGPRYDRGRQAMQAAEVFDFRVFFVMRGARLAAMVGRENAVVLARVNKVGPRVILAPPHSCRSIRLQPRPSRHGSSAIEREAASCCSHIGRHLVVLLSSSCPALHPARSRFQILLPSTARLMSSSESNRISTDGPQPLTCA